MEARGLTFFTHPYSWYAQRVQLALEEKGIPYTPIDVDLANKPEALLDPYDHPQWQTTGRIAGHYGMAGENSIHPHGRAVLYGAKFGFLDVVVAPFYNLGMVAVPGPDEIPRYRKCLEAIVARPTYKAVLPSNEKSRQYFVVKFFARKEAVAEATGAEAAPPSDQRFEMDLRQQYWWRCSQFG
ncbi:unnamed protein product [Calypogeia fissa]